MVFVANTVEDVILIVAEKKVVETRAMTMIGTLERYKALVEVGANDCDG